MEVYSMVSFFLAFLASAHHRSGNKPTDFVPDDKKKNINSPSAASASPGPVVNQLDDTARETFATGRPLEDNPDLQQCKHCKKSVLKTAAKAHIAGCLKIKKEKAQRKKVAREARERAKEAAREQEAKKAEVENGDGKGDDDSDGDEDISPDKKATGNKTAKKAAGKKPEDDKKGKKRKADGDLDKGPKKKKKDEPKAKVAKPKGSRRKARSFGLVPPILILYLQAPLTSNANAV